MKLNFEKEKKKETMSCIIEGNEFTLKTGTALTWPDPIVLISTDLGYQAALNRAISRGKKVHVEKIVIPKMTGKLKPNERITAIEFDPTLSQKLWMQYKNLIADILGDNQIRTVILDTGTDLHKLCRMAHHGKLNQVKPFHYAAPNRDFIETHDQFLYEAGCDKNSVFIHHTRKQYVKSNTKDESVWNGLWEFDGHESLPKAVDAVFRVTRSGEQVTWKVMKARDRLDAVNMEFEFYEENGDGEFEETGMLDWEVLKEFIL